MNMALVWKMRNNSMNNLHKISITVLLVFPFLLSSIMCCCLKKALAASGGGVPSCHEHANKADAGHKSQRSHDCQCLKVLSDKPNNDFAIQLIPAHYYGAFLKDGKMLARFFHDALLDNTSLFSDRPPPILISASIPVYLKISVLRI